MWQASITLAHLRQRAELMTRVRAFFSERCILEVDVPILGQAPVTDPYITALTTTCSALPRQKLYLQTSPEYFMKRLLAMGAPSMYYFGKSFRDDELGRLHNPEFTMLEWYHLGFDDHALMDEVAQLCTEIIGPIAVEKITYQALFEQHFALNPHTASVAELAPLVHEYIGKIEGMPILSRDMALQLLMSDVLEPRLDKNKLSFVHDFPASQAALARLKTVAGMEVAARFEVYGAGMELANGYHELAEVKVQKARFAKDLKVRVEEGKASVPVDQQLLDALAQGCFPDCAGVALGFDRLLMWALGVKALKSIQSFALV